MTAVVLEKLRCTHCGAPLPQPRPGDAYVRCEYCGFVNRVSDSAAYVEHLKREVARWLSQLLPQQVIVSTTADPVARYHVFQAYVKPRLIPVSVNARTKFIEIVYRPLISLAPAYRVDCADPRSMFEESVKVESVMELAVSEDDKSFISYIRRNLLVAAYVCNAAADAVEEKYAESARNIDEALKLVSGPEERALVARLSVARSVYAALDELHRRNPLAALNILRSAEFVLEEVSARPWDPAASKHLAALETERDVMRLAKLMAELSLAYFERGMDPLEPIPAIKRALLYAVDNARAVGASIKEVVSTTEAWTRVVSSRAGREAVKVLGDGDAYVPFYVVSVGVTYTSGLVLKTGLEARTDVLVSAVPPVLRGLTDVFGVYAGKPVSLEKERDRLSLTRGLVESARVDYLRRPAALPLLSQSMAEHLVDQYLSSVRHRYGGKLKLATTQARELVFVGVTLEGSAVRAQVPLAVLSASADDLRSILV